MAATSGYSSNLLGNPSVPTIKLAMTFQALLFCPDEKTARVTTQVLTELEFGVEACTEPFAAVKKLMGQHFDAIVVDCDNEQNASLLFKSARNSSSNQASLSVAVVEGQAGVANAFRIGANLVLTKPINVEQAKSTLRVARGLLRKGTDGKTPTAPASTQGPAAPAVRPTGVADAARPSSQLTQAPRTAPPTFQPLRPTPAPATAVAKTNLDPGSVLDFEEDVTAATGGIEDSVLDTSDQNPVFPGAVAPSVRPQEKANPWQPVSQPAEAPRPVAAAPAARPQGIAAAPAPPAATAHPASDLFVNPARQGGAASAPAPAREIPKSVPPAPPVASNIPPASAPTTGPLAPNFVLDEPETDSSKKKLVIIGAIAAAVIAVAYFSWSSMHGSKQNAAPAATQVQQAQTPAPTTPKPSAAEVQPQITAPEVTLPAPPPQSSSPSPSRTAPKTDGADEEQEVEVTHPGSPAAAPKQTIVVKSDLGSQTAAQKQQQLQQASNADVLAPPVISGSGNGDQISHIMQSTQASVPNPAPPQEVLKISQGVTQGLLIKRVQPVFPRQAQQMHLQGSVQLQALISKTGNISSVKVLSGDPTLARAAMDAVKQWKYKPYYLNGDPVDIQTQITVNFKLP